MGPSRVGGGMAHSPSSSGIFFQGDGQSQAAGNSNLNCFGNTSNSIPGSIRSNMVPVSGDVSNTVLNSVANSGPSVGASSLVTDANSGLSGGPRLQRSVSINNESYMRLPASPMSFSSNNISISGSSVIDGPSGIPQNSNHDLNTHQVQQGYPRQGASSATSLPPPRLGQASHPNFSGPFMQDPDNISQLHKKPRLDIKHEDILQQQVLQQYLQRQDSMQLQSPNPQLQAIIQQQRLRQQQQILQSMPPVQRAHLMQQQQQQQLQLRQQQQQLQLRQQLLQQNMQPTTLKRPYDVSANGVCSRRLMQYLYHQRQRPADNTIAYWRKFVSEYYSPRAKKRWCLSLYDNVGNQSLGVFPQAAMDAWQCEICGSKSGRGFEATFEVLPRLNEIKFGSGVIDELLFLDSPRELRHNSGIMTLEYNKAVQETVYEQLRVVREGRLRVIFSPDLKIISWEFCAQRHEELLPRRLVAPQVNKLLQVAQKCQSTIAESGNDGVSQQDLQTNSNMVVTAGRQLARSLELQSLNDLGFSKRYVRCLQISEVVNSMKDLMYFCKDSKVGPIDGLKNFPRRTNSAKLQLGEMQDHRQLTNIQDQNALNKLVALHSGLNNPSNNNMVGQGAPLNGTPQALGNSNYQNLLMRQNSLHSNSQQESSPFMNSNQNASSPFQGSAAILPGALQNSNIPFNGFSGSGHLLQHRSGSGSGSGSGGIQHQNHHHPPSSQGSSQHHMIQQLLQDMKNNNNGGGPKQSLSGQSGGNGNVIQEGPRYGNNTSSGTSLHVNGSGGSGPPIPTRNNSFKATASQSDSSAGGGNNGTNQKTQDVQQDLHLSDEVLQDIANDFTDSGFFNNDDLEDSMGYGWKA